jgi:hypothetical protein
MRATEIIQPLEIVQPDIGAAVLWDTHDIDQIGGGKKISGKTNPRGLAPAGIFGCSRVEARSISEPSP